MIYNEQAETYLRFRMAYEELKLEFREVRIKGGRWKKPIRTHEDIEFDLVICEVGRITQDAMWEWLETQ